MRRDCQLHFADAEGNLVSLRRVDFGDRSIGESFLQQQLHKSPSILPVDEIDDDGSVGHLYSSRKLVQVFEVRSQPPILVG